MKANFKRFKKAPDGSIRVLAGSPANFDVIEVPQSEGSAEKVLAYAASKLGLTTEQLEITAYKELWNIRKSRFVEW